MKADVSYNDFRGIVAADISDRIGDIQGDDLERIAAFLQLDQTRFQIIALSIFGVEAPCLSLICIDKKKSSAEKSHIVSMGVDNDKFNGFRSLFKRMHIILQDSNNKDVPAIETIHVNEEVSFESFHP